MRDDVDELAGRISDEEASYAPRFVGQFVDKLASKRLRTTIHLVQMVDFDRYVGDRRACSALAQNADLGERRLAGGKRDDPSEIHDGIKPEEIGVEVSNVGDDVGCDIRHDAQHRHLATY